MLQFQNMISYADLVNFVLLVIAFVGIFVVRRQVKQGRATFFKELYLLVFADPDISDAFYLLETRQFVYGATLGHSPQEQLVNRLLRFLDLVCEAYAGRLLTEQEMNFFQSQFLRVYENPIMKGYLKFLSEQYSQVEAGPTPFPSFISYCEKASSNKT
jgi:hypothetical protein